MELRDASSKISGWFAKRREKALDNAYEGALTIQKLERELFGGEKITHVPEKSKTVCDYAESLRDRQLLKVRLNLVQFRANCFLFDSQSNPEISQEVDPVAAQSEAESERQTILQKLNFIESIVSKYRHEGALLSLLNGEADLELLTPEPGTIPARDLTVDMPSLEADKHRKYENFLPRLRSQIQDSADYEQQVISNLRLRREQNRIAIRWLSILLIVPLAVQVLSRNLIFEPLLGSYSDRNPADVVLNTEVQEEFAQRYLLAKEKLEVATLLGFYNEMDDGKRQEKLQEAAFDIWREAREEELNGLKNLLADVLALGTFLILLLIGRNKLPFIRSVINRTFLNLRDPVKVFFFILITDIFVGFHSAEGWEVILEGLCQHFGIPESKLFINGFIATVPVVIDACIKFWIFSYLTRYSPSASAIYERMNT